MPNDNSSIIVCGQRYDTGQRVIVWEDDPSISAYTPRCVTNPGIYPTSPAKGLGEMATRYRERRSLGTDRSLSRLQQVLKQFVIHHDGMGTSRDTFRVLHDERGLSVHFLIDNNGDIYQTLDVVDCGFQAAGVNEISIGVELCNRGDAQLYPDFYKGKRDKITATINKHQFLCFVYTEEQMQAMVNLGRVLARLFPGLPQDYPKGGDGEQLWDTLAGDPREFSGYLGHYHVTDRKWDPGPWDFKKFISQIRGRVFYPALPGKENKEVPQESEKAEELAHDLYENNETQGDGGYFPVGPLGAAFLWHGGLHVRDERGKPVVAPFAGKIVAARHKAEDDWPSIGSTNFVLIKHEMGVSGQPVKFWTLVAHLDEEKEDAEKAPMWFKRAMAGKAAEKLKAGEVALLDDPVGAGEVIGHFGEAGPRGARAGQIHFETFSDEEFGAKVDAKFWTPLEGGKSRFADPRASAYNGYITRYMDYNNDGVLHPKELVYFFQAPQTKQYREAFRKYTIHHPSEWSDIGGDFARALWASPEYRKLVPPARMRQVYEDQIASMFFWTDEVGEHAGLPSDRMVWSYHPITFVLWMQEKLKGQVQEAKALQSADAFKGEKPPPDIKDDASEGAEGFMDDEDALFGEAAKKLTLEQLAEGYPD